MRARRQEIAALAAAISLHAGVLFFLGATLGDSSSSTAPASRSVIAWEIELAEPPEVDALHDAVENSSANVGAMARFVPRTSARPAEPESVEAETGDLVESARDGEGKDVEPSAP